MGENISPREIENVLLSMRSDHAGGRGRRS